MRVLHFALTEICGLAADLALASLLIFYFGVDSLVARLSDTATGRLTPSWRLNRSNGDESNKMNSFLMKAVTLTSRIVGVWLFALLQWRNPLLQPLVPLAFSALTALALAIDGYGRLQRQQRDQN